MPASVTLPMPLKHGTRSTGFRARRFSTRSLDVIERLGDTLLMMMVSFDSHSHVHRQGQPGLDFDGFEDGGWHGASRMPDVLGADFIDRAILNPAKDALAPVHLG